MKKHTKASFDTPQHGGKISIETRVAQRHRRVRIQDGLLLALHAGIGIGIAVAAPNAVQLLKFLPLNSGNRKVHIGKRVAQARSRLLKRGLIKKHVHNDGSYSFSLTKKGETHVLKLETIAPLAVEPKTWDGKWRVVIFDVWERRRRARDILRLRMRTIGFVQLQDSVWVYPYPCEEFIVFARTELKLGKALIYIVAEEIEYDEWLRTHFKLPK
jgi:hypothetical protein